MSLVEELQKMKQQSVKSHKQPTAKAWAISIEPIKTNANSEALAVIIMAA